MYCPSCGTQNADTSKFCLKCGAALPVNLKPAVTPQAQPAPIVTATTWSGWRSVGVLTLIGGIISVLAFFMSWFTTPAINLGGPSLAGQINGWALFRVPFDVLGNLSQARSGNVFGYLSGQMQLFLIVYLIDSVLLILTPILGIVITVNSWQMLQSSDAATGKARQRRNKRLAIVGLVPPIVLVMLFILLVAALNNPYGGRAVDPMSVLRLIDFGLWLTLAALLLILLAGPLAAPKQR